MLIGGVGGNEIENHFYISTVSFIKQAIEIFKVSEDLINVAIVRDVITKIGHGRTIDLNSPIV
jgi:hypothetical protein